MSNYGKFNLCCNPLQITNHRVKNSLRRASANQQKLHNLNNSDYLCTTCRKSLDTKSTSSFEEVIVDKVDDESQNFDTEEITLSIPNTLSGKIN